MKILKVLDVLSITEEHRRLTMDSIKDAYTAHRRKERSDHTKRQKDFWAGKS